MESSPGASKMSMLKGRLCTVLIWVLLWLVGGSFLCGQVAAAENVENKLKVAFLLNFAKFTSWPPTAFANSDAPFLICAPENDPFDGAMNVLVKKQVRGRAIQICYADRTNGKTLCHLVFLGQAEAGRQTEMLQAMRGKPVLTVSDIPGFAEAGGVIELRRKDNRLAFVVNNHAALAAGLQLSSSFLQLALEVL